MRNHWRVWPIVVALTLSVAMAGCQTVTDEHRGAAVGAGAGAGALPGDTEAAVAGGLVGALVGGTIGHYGYDRQRGPEATRDLYKYEDAYGTMISIEDAVVTPPYIYPGATAAIEVTYALLHPQGVTPVREIRQITHEGRLVGQPEVMVERAAGTYTSSIPLHLPETAARGIYEVTAIIESGTARDSRQIAFRVR